MRRQAIGGGKRSRGSTIRSAEETLRVGPATQSPARSRELGGEGGPVGQCAWPFRWHVYLLVGG